MTIQELRARLQSVTGEDTQFTAKCPAHDDRQNSLSVGLSDDGTKILLNCFAGCSPERVAESLGLKLSDLFATQDAPAPQKDNRLTYQYHDTSGTLLYTKTRVDKSDGTKSFYFKQPDGTKGVKGVQRVRYWANRYHTEQGERQIIPAGTGAARCGLSSCGERDD